MNVEPEGVKRLTSEIAKVESADLKAFRENDTVYLVIRNAPEELRKIADALEKANIREVKALVAYQDPKAKGAGGAEGAEKPKAPPPGP